MPRRYGAGSVYQRSRDGKWVATWETGASGKRSRRSVVGDTSGQAIRRMQQAQREASSSSKSPRPTASVGAFLEMWLRDVVRVTRRERTLVGYRAIVSGLAPHLRDDTDLHDPDLPHLLQVWLSGLDKHPRTVRHYAACLRAAFGYGVRKGMMDRNPAADLDLPAVPRVERIPLTPTELRAFLDASTDDPLHALWVTAAWTGMRQGELLGLRWEDVSLKRAQIQVRRSLSRLPPRHKREGWRYDLTEPKTERSRRTVPLLPAVVEALRPLERTYFRDRPSLDQGLVFATANGSPLDAPTVSRAFQQALRKAGIRVVRFHDARHGAASMLIESGADLATVSAILGHSTIATTVDLYGHLTETHKQAAMARLQGLA